MNKILDKYESEILNEKNKNKELEEIIKKYEDEKAKREEEEYNRNKLTRKISRLSSRLEDYQQKLDTANEQLATTHNELEKLKKQSSNNSLSSRLSLRSIRNEYPIITPEKYELIKFVQYRKLKWILFRNKIQYKEDYSHFIWSPIRNEKDFEDFGNYLINTSSDLQQQIEELKDNQAELIEQLAKKENDYNKLNLNFAKLFNRKKTGDINQDKLIETIDKLTRENKKLQLALKNMKHGDNFIGISFIEDDINGSQFIDDDLEEILDNLVKSENLSNGKNNKKITFKMTNQLKNSVDSLLGQNNLNPNVKFILASIFKQLNLNDEDIQYLLGKGRGVISLSPMNA